MSQAEEVERLKLASFSGSGTRIIEMVEYATMGNFSEYDKAYINISDDFVGIISSLPANAASSYSTFYTDYIDEATATDGYTEALVDVDTFLFYLELVERGEDIRVDFFGNETGELATEVSITGSMSANLFLPTSEKEYEKIPLWLPDRFDEDEVYGKNKLETEIVTDVSEIQKIIEVKEADEIKGIDTFPIVVEGGELTLDVADEMARNTVYGKLQAEVDGPDLSNEYNVGFKEAFETLRGEVTLHASPGNSPLSIVKRLDDGTIRHVVGATT